MGLFVIAHHEQARTHPEATPMRLEQLDPGSAALHPTKVLVLNRREQATVRSMRRLCADLERIGYPGANVVGTWLEGLPTDEETPA